MTRAKTYGGAVICLFLAAAVEAQEGGLEQAGSAPVEQPQAAPVSPAQPTSAPSGADVSDISLEELLNAKVTVATKTETSARETPGVVTVVTREEIVASGARDLMDVLRLVPGFSFGMDVQGVVGLAFRGNWAHEGKALLLIDGQEMNELLYSSLQFGEHYPIDNLERIEIIRGPGSVIYGGYAELAVINLITRSAASQNGISVGSSYGQQGSDYGHRRLSLGVGREFGPEKEGAFTLYATAGQALRSLEPYVDFAGTETRMGQDSATDPINVNLGVKYRDLKLRLLYDRYFMKTADAFGAPIELVSEMYFNTLIADAQYDLKLGDRVTLSPRFNYRNMTPWEEPRQDHEFFYSKSVSRTLGSLYLGWQALDSLNIGVGLEGSYDLAWLKVDEEMGLQTRFQNGEASIAFTNLAGYAQALWDTPFVNISAGARYEQHSDFGGSFVPRVGLTKVIDRFHAKLLYSQAFRAPAVENIRLQPTEPGQEIKPEQTQVIEAELGYQLTKAMYVSANVFDINIDRPIVYFFDEATEAESYSNYDKTGSRGVELEYRYRRGPHFMTLSYTYATAAGKNSVELYEVPGRDDVLLAMPAHKVTALLNVNVYEGLSITPSMTWTSKVAGYLTNAETVQGQPAQLLANVYLSYQSLGLKGLNAGLGVFNLLDQKQGFVQPYAGGHAPLPSRGREVVGNVSYQYNFE